MAPWWNSLRVRLMLIVLVGMLPALGFILHDGIETWYSAHRSAQEQALSLANDVSRQHRVMVDLTRRMLATLAEDLSRRIDFDSCPPVFPALSVDRPFLFYANVGYADKNGKIFCSLMAAPKSGPAVSIPCVEHALRARDLSIGSLEMGGLAGRGKIDFTYPVVDNAGIVKMVAFASLDISWFDDLAARLRLPEGATVTMVDSGGVVLSRNLDPEKWVGHADPDAEIVKTVISRRAGVTEARGIDRVQRIYGFGPLGETDDAGYIYVGIPKETVVAGARKELLTHLAWLGIVAVLGFVTLPTGAYPYFMRNVNALLGAAGKIAAGDLTARAGLKSTQGEMGQLGVAFDRMAQALQVRDRQRKQAEEHLQREEQFVASVVDNLPGSFYLFDHEGKVLRWGKQLERVTGYSEHDISSMSPLDFIAGEDRAAAAQAIQDAFAGTDVCIEMRIVTKDGVKIPHLLTAQQTVAMGVPCIMGVGLDISRQKSVEHALAESEQTLRTILDTVPYGILLSHNRVIRWANAACARMLGFLSQDDYVGRDTRILYATDKEYERVGRELYRDLHPGRIAEIDAIHVRKDGSPFHVNIRLKLVDPDSGASGIVIAAVSDISERKQHETALSASERRFRELIENIELCSVILDVNGNVVFCNDFLLKLTDRRRSEVLEQDWFGLFFGEERANGLRTRYREAVSRGTTPFHTETRIRTRHGVERLTKWTTTLLRDVNGQIVGSASIGEDITQQREAEEALRLSKDTLEAVFNAITESILVLGADGCILAANATAAERLGKPVQELIGQTVYDFLPSELAESRRAQRERVVASGKPIRFQDRRAACLYDIHVYPMKETGDPPDRAVVFGADITEKERAIEALFLEKQKFEILCEQAPFGMVMIDRDGMFLYINPRFKEMFGYDPDDIPSGAQWFALAYPSVSYRQEVLDAWKIDLSRARVGEPRSRTFTVRCKDKTEKIARFIPVQLQSGNHLMTVEDITEQRLAEERLRETQERFRAIFESAMDCIFIKDRSGRYAQVNPAMERLFGLPAAEFEGMTDEALFGDEAAVHSREVDSRVLRGHSVEEEYTKPVNGIPTTFSIVKVPLRDAAGKIAGLCGIARDVTERREAGQKGALRTKLHCRGLTLDYPSAAMRSTVTEVQLAAATGSTVLLLGESGSGKDYLARMIHNRSPRSGGPYFVINCATVSPHLAESELFGYEAGAFTGATRRKLGLLELAEGGTLLLNEVGELPPPVQAKLLSFLDTSEFTRVGGEKQATANARILAATNRDLEHEIAEGNFRQDLFYRLNVFGIHVPCLRDRLDDLPILVREILATLAESMQLTGQPEIGPGVMEAMASYHWPGNVRELRNVLERALIVSPSGIVMVPSLALEPKAGEWALTLHFPKNRSLSDITGEVRKSLVVEALRRTNGNKTRAAQLLGVSRYSIINYLKEFGITV